MFHIFSRMSSYTLTEAKIFIGQPEISSTSPFRNSAIMSDETDELHLDDTHEVIMPTNPFESRKYRVKFVCDKCEHTWTRTFNAPPLKDPPCPNKACADKQRIASLELQLKNLTAMVEEGRAPGHIGNNVRVRAIDTTAEVVMQDYSLTDLKDRAEPGENLVQKLPPPMQKAADNFFGGPQKALGSGDTMHQRRMQALGRKAIAGAFRDSAVAPNQVLPTTRPPVVREMNPGYVKR